MLQQDFDALLPLEDVEKVAINAAIRKVTSSEHRISIVGMSFNKGKVGFSVSGRLVICFASRNSYLYG